MLYSLEISMWGQGKKRTPTMAYQLHSVVDMLTTYVY